MSQQNPDYAEVSSPRRSGLVHTALVWVVTTIGIHYIFLGFAALGFVALVSWIALRNVYSVLGVCLLAVLGYLPSFLDRSELTAKGRAWDSFRQWSIWRYGHEVSATGASRFLNYPHLPLSSSYLFFVPPVRESSCHKNCSAGALQEIHFCLQVSRSLRGSAPSVTSLDCWVDGFHFQVQSSRPHYPLAPFYVRRRV
jgi:energy-converting hydrogenase Eha subunit E